MNAVIYIFGRVFIALVQALPLVTVARIGRFFGGVAYHLDARHRRVVLQNLAECFGNEKPAGEIREIARENFRRIGENYLSAIKTAAMTFEQLKPHVKFISTERLLPPRRIVVAIGHFGNFELYARFGDAAPGYKTATTYRALKQPALNKLMQTLRERSGCLFFERRSDGPLLRTAMNQPAIIIGLLSDQHGGAKGIRLPFLGCDCSTNAAAPVFALRYDCEFYTGFCYRTGLAQWQLELGDYIPIRDEKGQLRPVVDLTRDMLASHEKAVLRDPANWFWVHRRWKTEPARAKVENGD